MAKLVRKVGSIEYHRNGSCEGFHCVRFTGPDGELLAIVREATFSAAVVSLEDPSRKFRGYVFEPELRAVIQKWENKRDAELYGKESAK